MTCRPQRRSPGQRDHGGFAWRRCEEGNQRRTLAADDRVGISSYYDTYANVGGAARDLSIGRDGTIWAISNTPSGAAGNYKVVRWSGGAWQSSDGVGVRIAVDNLGRPWVTQADGTIFVRSENSTSSGYWQYIVGQARDIAIGSNDGVWCLGWDSVPGGYSVWKLNAALSWDRANTGGGTRIAVDETDHPWVVTSSGAIQRRLSNSASSGDWETLPGSATDIGIGPEGHAWIITNTSYAGGKQLAVWSEQGEITNEKGVISTFMHREWVPVAKGGTNVSVGPNGVPWGTDSSFAVWRPVK